MEGIQIKGGRALAGEVLIQGSKNAALPIMAASVLVPGLTVLKNCPEISDVACMCEILKSVGAKVTRENKTLLIDASVLTRHRLPAEYVTRMRSSVVLAGAMLGRCGRITFHYPGGCVIGDRPIDLHIRALEQLGAVFEEEGEALGASACRLKGARIVLPFPSVGATENALLAAVLAEGTTEICRCAREPEIEALCDFLNAAGAKITGGGSTHLTVEGVCRLHSAEYRIEPDRIVAGTYLIGTLAAGGDVFLRNAPAGQLREVMGLASRMGAVLRTQPDGMSVKMTGQLRSPGFVETGVYPAFPTDLQSPMLVAMCKAEGRSSLKERIFNGRLDVVSELNRMGAGITARDNCAWMDGGRQLKGCSVTARELRGGAALVLAGVCAEGFTQVYNRSFIDRGYEDIVRDLKCLGANIGSEK